MSRPRETAGPLAAGGFSSSGTCPVRSPVRGCSQPAGRAGRRRICLGGGPVDLPGGPSARSVGDRVAAASARWARPVLVLGWFAVSVGDDYSGDSSQGEDGG